MDLISKSLRFLYILVYPFLHDSIPPCQYIERLLPTNLFNVLFGAQYFEPILKKLVSRGCKLFHSFQSYIPKKQHKNSRRHYWFHLFRSKKAHIFRLNLICKYMKLMLSRFLMVQLVDFIVFLSQSLLYSWVLFSVDIFIQVREANW